MQSQQPLPTLTGTPRGLFVRVIAMGQERINVRSGPDALLYPIIGVMVIGQEAPAIGRTMGGDWTLIEYPGVPGGQGWVYSIYVTVRGGELPIVESPPTPTLQFTPTFDPTLSAQFAFVREPTRLATFTPAPPIVIPTFEDVPVGNMPDFGIPMGLIIFIFALAGILLAAISFVQRR